MRFNPRDVVREEVFPYFRGNFKLNSTMISSSTILQKALSQGIVFIDPRIDYAFKLIFGTPGNEDLLLRLVQAILP